MPTRDGYTLAEMRAEMARLSALLMRKNTEFLEREAALLKKFERDDDILRNSKLESDPILINASAVAKTCAVLAGGLAQVIQAELAYASYYRGRPSDAIAR